MKKVTFLVAFFALLQAASGTPIFALERLQDDSKRNVEETLELAGQDVADELEELIQQLEMSAEKIGQQLERWAEDNSQELEAWSQKHAQKWEVWGDRFGQKMERLAEEQDDIWGEWAQGYEKNLQRWTAKLESGELEPDQVGQFLEQNLKTLSRMPLGQMLDQALEDGLGQLSEAPWESLDELGELAKKAFEESLSELSEILDENSEERKPLEEGVGQAIEEFDSSIRRKLPEANDSPLRVREDPRVRALKKLREQEGVTRQQRARIDELIKTYEDASHLKLELRNAAGHDRPLRIQKPRIEGPRTDPVKEKIKREKKRQIQKESRQPKAETFKDALRKSDQKAKQLDARLPKRLDGKNMERGQNKPSNSRQDASPRIQRDGRDGKANRKPAAETNRGSSAKSDAKTKSDVELLREEISRLRREVEQLKKESDK